jgi:predicted acylesterase/phospholipase RssA
MGCTKSAVRWTTNNGSLLLSSQVLQSRFYWNLSFSGAGHLLPYHLGVTNTLLPEKDENKNEKEEKRQQKKQQFRLPIKSIVGSSSGAIAATVSTILPHRLDEYTDRFSQDRGYAFKNLREMLLVEENSAPRKEETVDEEIPLLSICTTRCLYGGIELFSFGGDGHNDMYSSFKEPKKQGKGEEPQKYARLLKAIEASCRIPRSFHPFDMFGLPNNLLLQRITSSIGGAFNNNNNDNKNCHQHYYYFPDEEGIEIDGQFYVDGGIAAPFPNTPYDFDDSVTGRIVVSPVAGDYYDRYNTSTNNKQSSSLSSSQLRVISPRDESWALPSLLA